MSDDWKDEILLRLQRSLIYETLCNKCEKDPAGPDVLSLIQKMVLYAHHRSKTVIKNMPEFTLHDSEHLFRVKWTPLSRQKIIKVKLMFIIIY